MLKTFIFVTALAAGAANAADLSVFGLELGKPASLPECPFKRTSGGWKMYDVVPNITCVQDAHKLNGYPQPVREMNFGRDSAPAIVKNWRAFLLEDQEGRLIGIHFLTQGLETQDLVLSQLKSKYGVPTSVTPRTIRTAVGGPFETFDARWTLSDVVVDFRATSERIDRGEVTIDLPAAAALRQQWLMNPKEQKL